MTAPNVLPDPGYKKPTKSGMDLLTQAMEDYDKLHAEIRMVSDSLNHGGLIDTLKSIAGPLKLSTPPRIPKFFWQ